MLGSLSRVGAAAELRGSDRDPGPNALGLGRRGVKMRGRGWGLKLMGWDARVGDAGAGARGDVDTRVLLRRGVGLRTVAAGLTGWG